MRDQGHIIGGEGPWGTSKGVRDQGLRDQWCFIGAKEPGALHRAEMHLMELSDEGPGHFIGVRDQGHFIGVRNQGHFIGVRYTVKG